jgi:uncharacterized protein YrzB (UPF0473 family)
MSHTTIEKEETTMNENEREFFTLVDEDGSEIEFEKIGEITLNEKVYFAMIPAEAPENAQNDGGFCEYVVLRLEKDEDGEDTLVSVDDDDEFDNVADVFDDMFSEEIDYDGN